MATKSKTRHEALGLTLDEVRRMYREVLRTRLASEKIMALNRMGRVPFAAGVDGHEAAQVGAAWCVDVGTDWVVPYYRDMGVAFVLGFTVLDEFRSVLAKSTDRWSGGRAMLNMFSAPAMRVLTRSVLVGTEFPHAVGLALAMRNRGEKGIVFAFGGDASTSPGDFHEAANFATIHKLPVVFVIENNQIAISTRLDKQMAVKDVAMKAVAYAMPGTIADGMDVLDAYEKTKAAADRARRGEGASLVELKCYRYQPHTSDDDDMKYRTRAEVDEWRARDPVVRGREYLLSQCVSPHELAAMRSELDVMRSDLDAEIEAAIAQAESEPDPTPADAMSHVYAMDTPPPPGTRA